MGGAIDGRLGISSTLSSQQSSDLEKTEAEVRQMLTAAEKFRRELEFLQKGGNPLDLDTWSAASVSIQSTSLTDQHPEQFVTSETKGSFEVTASPHGDSVESSGRLGVPSFCEPNSADNLMLFDGDNKFSEVERRAVHPPTSKITLSEHYSQLDSGQNARESGDSAALELPKKSYKRRIRSRPNRDGTRSSTTDAALSRGGQSFFRFHHASGDVKGLVVAASLEQNGLSSFNSKLKGSNASMAIKNVASNSHSDMESDGVLAVETTLGQVPGPSSAVSDANASQNPRRNQHDQPLKSDTRESLPNMAFVEPESLEGVEQDKLAVCQHLPCVDTQSAKNLAFLGQANGFGATEGERKSMPHNGSHRAALPTKGLDSRPSCTQTGQSLDVNNENELPTSPRNVNCNGTMEQSFALIEVPGKESNDLVIEKEVKMLNIANSNSDSCHWDHIEDDSDLKEEEGLKKSEFAWRNGLKNPVSTEGVNSDGSTAPETDREPGNVLGSNSFPRGGSATCRPQGSNGTSYWESTSVGGPTDVAEETACSQRNLNSATEEHEESILKEAWIIEAKRKRIAELSVSTLPLESHQNSHWDFVLEEMSWLANDFAQERLWKVTAAAQISRRVAFTSQIRYQQKKSLWKQKEVANTLGRAVMEFWNMIQVKCKELELQCLDTDSKQRIQGYAMRFLKHNSSHAQYNAAQAPLIPDMISDVGLIDISWEHNLTEENLFYTVPPGAIEVYRNSIESHLLQSERTWSSMQEEADTSGYDAVADNTFEEDDGETRAYYLPGAFEGSRSSKAAQKRRKNFKFNTAKSYEMGADLPLMESIERNIETQSLVSSGKRPGSSLNGSIPTKRLRTASRQRVLGPFNAGASGHIQTRNRTDASSGDTNYFQEEQSTVHGGARMPNNTEAESVGDYEKQLQFDSAEVPDRPWKKKKAKHPGASFDHQWHFDSNFQNDQKDYSKRRLDTHQLDSNGSNGLYIQHNLKKPKMRQSSDNSFDNLTPLARSIPSPVSSQMSNMSNPKKFMELLVHDRGRKSKTLKIPAGQPGSGSPWSLFEDQALVVLVHDMGPNWELISDAINSILQSKCIFHKSEECKERHKILMDRNSGDGADSAEDSGLSQPYPSTLPGIPEGSARQLFQRLQGPMEEDTLKSHFEKIIMIGQKQYDRRTQNDNQDPNQLQQPHSSHTLALSQVCPNNLNGGPVLTPVELCDAIASSPDVPPVGYQGPHSGGLPISNQGNGTTMLPGSSSSSSVPSSSNVVLGNDFLSASVPLNPSVREGRHGIPRMGSFSKDDQHRMQQYNQMLSARKLQQSSLSPGSHSGTDRGVRMLPSGNGVGVRSGTDRSMTMARSGFQGVASPSTPSSGSVLSSGMAMPSTANMHSGAGPGQVSSMLRPHDAMPLIRSNKNSDHQRQIIPADLQMQQVSQGGSSQGVPQFASGMSSSFPNRAVQPSIQSYPLHHQQQAQPVSSQQSPNVLGSNSHNRNHLQGPPNHASNTSPPAFGIRFGKERQLQQQRLLQKQQFATSSSMMPRAQPPKSQLPVSSPRNSTQLQSQSSPPVLLSPKGPTSMTSVARNVQKHLLAAPHGLVQNPQTGGNQLVKLQQPHQSQQFQQPGRQQPQQRQQTKLMKGGGRGTMMMPQNLPVDPSLPNGLSGDLSTAEKGAQRVAHHLLKSQGNLYSGPSGLNPAVQAGSKQSGPHSSSSQPHQQKISSSQMQAASSKKVQQQKPSHSSDNGNNQNHAPSFVALSSTLPVMTPSNHQHPQPQPHQKLMSLSRGTTAQRVVNNRMVNSSEPPTSKLEARETAQAEQSMPFSNSHMSKTASMPQAPCTGTNSETPVVSCAGAPRWKISEPFNDSSGAKLGNATQFGRNSMQTSPPPRNSAETGSEHSGPAVNQSMVHRQSLSESLPNPVGHDVGVQWQQLPSS